MATQWTLPRLPHRYHNMFMLQDAQHHLFIAVTSNGRPGGGVVIFRCPGPGYNTLEEVWAPGQEAAYRLNNLYVHNGYGMVSYTREDGTPMLAVIPRFAR